ncbi:MAG: universal stress protein [Planctomycetota bacterium]
MSELDSSLGKHVDDAMRMFERSHVGPANLINATRPSKVLVALDGSPQDEASLAAAAYLATATRTETVIVDARVSDRELPDILESAAAEVSGARPISVPARPPENASGGDDPAAEAVADDPPYDRILRTVAQQRPSLLIVPSPFGRDFDSIGTDSIGTVLDVLLRRCRIPMLVIRDPARLLPDAIQRIAMVIGMECDVNGRAAEWAFGMAVPENDAVQHRSGVFSLHLVIEKEQLENFRALLGVISPDQEITPDLVQRALAKTHETLTGAIAQTASQHGLEYRLMLQTGIEAPPKFNDPDDPALLVLPLEVDDNFGQGFVSHRIRSSPYPVVIVPGHVKED